MALSIPLGVTDFGDILVKDLDNVRHLLITGNTGTGKSVLLKSIIKSTETQSCRLILIDTKGVDFTKYTSSHLMMPVITDVNQAVYFLQNIQHVDNSLIIVIDELSDLIATSDAIQDILIKIAQNPQIYIIMATRKEDLLSPAFMDIFGNCISFNCGKIGDAQYMSNATRELAHIQTVK